MEESPTSNGPSGGHLNDAYDGWLRLFTEGAAIQADIVRELTRASLESGQILRRQYAALARAWMQAAAGTVPRSAPPVPAPAVGSTSGDRTRRDVDAPGTTAETTVQPPSRQPNRREQSFEAVSEREAASVAVGRGETSEPVPTGRGQPAPSTEAEETNTAADVEQLDAIDPEDAEELRSADVHTVEQLAAARPEELAAETDLDPRRVRVFVVGARRWRSW